MEKYLDLRNNIDESKLQIIGESIRNGGIAVFPTETVYGIGVNGLEKSSIEKLYLIKQRDFNKPINLLVSDINMIEQITKDINDIEYKLINTFFPGPFTIILKRKNIVPSILTANRDTVGIRIPDCNITQKLIKYASCPIATSSANITGYPSALNVNDIPKKIYDNVDYVVDGGNCKYGIASTIVQVIDNIPHVLREGSISKDTIYKVCNIL